MNTQIKLLSLLLALVMLVSTFVACDGGNQVTDDETKAPGESETVNSTEASETETVAETEYFPAIDKKDYGADYFLHIHGDVNPPSFYWVEESSNDALSQALFDRQQKVSDHLGVNIVAVRTQAQGAYVEPFKTAVKNKDGSVHTLLTHNYLGVNTLIAENFLLDLKTIPQLNMEADYWNVDFMESISIKDRYYLGFSNFNILYTNVISFNKDLMDKYADALDESVYSMVTNYHWTLDNMIALANLVYVDATGDGKTADDTFGLTGEVAVPFVNFLQASNINLVEQNEKGEYVVVVYNELNQDRTSTLVDKLKGLTTSDCCWTWGFQTGTQVNLTTKRALMWLTPSISLPALMDYDVNFGVLPYPMYDENQKDVGYRSLQWGGYISIPSYVDNLDMTAETIEMLSFYSDDVNLTFYEKLLGRQVADTPDDKKMLDIIWDGVCSDFGQTYHGVLSKTDLLYIVARLADPNSTKSIASFMAAVDKSANKMIKTYLDKIQ